MCVGNSPKQGFEGECGGCLLRWKWLSPNPEDNVEAGIYGTLSHSIRYMADYSSTTHTAQHEGPLLFSFSTVCSPFFHIAAFLSSLPTTYTSSSFTATP